MKKKYVSLLIRLAISIGLIGYFIYTLAQKEGGTGQALQKFIQAFADAPAHWLIPAGLMHIIGLCLLSLRWKILLRGQDVHTSYKQLFVFYVMAAFFNNFLPSTIGGDTVRVVESKKMTDSTVTSLMVVIVERLTGLMALVLIAAAGMVITFFRSAENDMQAWLSLGKVLAVFAVAGFLAHPKIMTRILNKTEKLLPEKIHSFLKKAYGAVEIYYKRPGTLMAALGVAVLLQFNMVIYFFLIAKALHQSPDPIEFMMKIPVLIFLLMTVPSVNGLGVRTAGFKGLMGYKAVHALAVESIDLGFRILYGIVGGIVFLVYRGQKKKDKF
jgi:uncharacterized protein (TIRG00374 family)